MQFFAVVANISAASNNQADDLTTAMDGVRRITEVALRNSDLSHDAQTTADKLDAEYEARLR